MVIKLCCANVKVKYKIISVSGINKCRLLEMGFIRNSIVEIINKNSNYGPFEVKLKNYRLALRIEEAENILVKSLDKNNDDS